MACNSLQSTKAHLMEYGLIDKDNNIINNKSERLNDLSESYKISSKENYGVDGNLFSISEGKVVFHLETFKKIDAIKEQQSNSFADDYSDGYADFMEEAMFEGDFMQPDFSRYYQYKSNQIKRIEKALYQVRQDIKKAKEDIVETKRLRALEHKLDLILNGDPEHKVLSLRDKLDEMKKDGYLSMLEDTANRDLDIAAQLLETGSFEDLKTAREIIEFYTQFGDWDVGRNENSLFRFAAEDIKLNEDGSLAIVPEVKEMLGLIAIKANNLKTDLTIKDDTMILNHIKNHSKVKKLGIEVTMETLFPSQGMKDIKIYDLFFMDITNGLTATNGLVPQFMRSHLGEVVAKASYKSAQIMAALATKDKAGRTLQERVNKALIKIDKKYKIGFRGASYDFFRQRDANGSYTGAIIQRYSSEFYSNFYSVANNYITARQKAFKSVGGTKLGLRNASNEMRKWIRENAVLVRPELFREVYEELGLVVPTMDSTYIDSMKEKLGENHFNEVKEQIISKVKEFKVKKEVYLDSLLEKDGVEHYDDLSGESKNKYSNWDKTNNPLTASLNYYGSKTNTLGSLQFNVIIPSTKKENYYDKNFKIVENNQDLHDFYKIIESFKDQIDELPTSTKNKILKRGIPHMAKGLIEILSDPDMRMLAKISKIYRNLISDIIDMFREIKQDESQVGMVNPLTGKPDYKVSDDFLKDNKEEIQITYDTMMSRIAMIMSSDVLKSNHSVDLSNLNAKTKERVFNVLKELYGVTTDAELFARLPNEKLETNPEINISKLIRAGATHRVVADESVDFPKIIKYYTKMISIYQARTLALPMLESMKNRYEDIPDVELTGQDKKIKNVDDDGNETKRKGVIGKRSNAVKQIDNWFNRGVLGNYGSRSEVGDLVTDKKALTPKEKKILALLQQQEKDISEQLDEMSLQDNEADKNESIFEKSQRDNDMMLLQNALTKNQKRQDKIGKNWSIKKGIDQLFNLQRFLGLGYNFNSYVTNFIEGQTSNFLADASGDYWEVGTIYKANNIVKGSFIKYASGNQVQTEGAAKTRIFMDRLDTLQDATNELQKASNNSALANINRLSPYAGTQRVEYLNQAPIMVSLLLSQEIKGKDKDGNEIISNVFDATNKDGTLKEEFNTKENNLNWVDGVGQEFLDLKVTLDKALVNIHGDYDSLRGNMASEYIAGKALLMFKRWLGRQIYNRLAWVEQIDLEAGIIDFKGRYLSHDKVSAALHGAILGAGGLGLIASGPIGIGIGAATGYIGGRLLRHQQKEVKLGAADSLKELAFLTGQIIVTPFKLVINNSTIIREITGGSIIKEADYEKRLPNYSSRDIKNIRANVAEMSLTLMWIAGILAAKAALWDDDDDEDSKKRMLHNLLVNRMMALSSSLTAYLSPKELITSFGKPAFMRMLDSVHKIGDDLNDLTMGNDTTLSGDNAGQSGLGTQVFKTFLPNLLKGQFGFKGQTQRQFQTSPYDAMFWGENKIYERKNKELRAIYKYQLERQGIKEEIIKEAIRRRFPNKEKGKSQKEWFEKINDNPPTDLNRIRLDAKGEVIKLKKKKKRSRKIF